MFKKISWIFLLSVFFQYALSQNCNINNIIGTSNDDIFSNSIFDQNNQCFYITGSSNSKPFLIKTDVNGNILSSFDLGITPTSYNILTLAPNGDILLFANTASNDFYVTRVNNLGVVIWSKRYNISGSSGQLRSGRLASVGADMYMISAMYLGPGSSSDDLMVLKIDGTGNIIWVNNFNQTDDQFYHIIPNGTGGAIITGGLHGGSQDFAMVEVDDAGDIINSVELEHPSMPYIEGYITKKTINNGYISLGKIYNGVDHDISIRKFNKNLNLVWEKTIQNKSWQWNCGARDLTEDSNGNIYISVDKPVITGGTIGVIVKLDSLGNYIWSKEISSIPSFQIYVENILGDEKIILMGTHTFSVGFGLKDGFLAKLDTSLTSCLTTNSSSILTSYSGYTTKPWIYSKYKPTINVTPHTVNSTTKIFSDTMPCNLCLLTADFNYDLNCAGDTSYFFDQSTDSLYNIVFHAWYISTGDSIIGISNPYYIFNQPGSYDITHIVKNDDCIDCYDTITKQIVITNDLEVDILEPDTTICKGSFINLSAMSKCGIPPFNYTWYDKNGNNVGSAQNISIYNILQTGYYIVQLTDSIGSTAFDTIDIEVLDYFAAFSLPSEVCIYDEFSVVSNTSQYNGSVTYNWNFGFEANIQFDSSYLPSNIYYNNFGNMTVSLIMTDDCGTDTAIQSIIVHELPNIYLSADTSICLGTTLVLSHTSNPLHNFIWLTNNNQVIGNQNTINTTVEYDQYVYLQITNENNCSQKDSIFIDVINTYFSLPNDTTICFNDTLWLTPYSLEPINQYIWSNGTLVNQSLGVSDAGVYWVVAQVGLKNCTVSDTIIIKTDSLPNFNFNPKDVFCMGDYYILDAETPNTLYLWNNGKTDSQIIVNKEGTYSVKLTNNCGTTNDDTIQIKMIDCSCNVYVPNTFSPNGDKFNGIFIPKTFCELEEYELQIYNRWGELIFTSIDILKGWDGSGYKQDIYIYKIKYKSAEPLSKIGHKQITGHVLLIK